MVEWSGLPLGSRRGIEAQVEEDDRMRIARDRSCFVVTETATRDGLAFVFTEHHDLRAHLVSAVRRCAGSAYAAQIYRRDGGVTLHVVERGSPTAEIEVFRFVTVTVPKVGMVFPAYDPPRAYDCLSLHDRYYLRHLLVLDWSGIAMLIPSHLPEPLLAPGELLRLMPGASGLSDVPREALVHLGLNDLVFHQPDEAADMIASLDQEQDDLP